MPPVSFGGDAPSDSADLGFSDVLDVISPVIRTPAGGQPQGITAVTIGGPVDTSIPSGETTGPVPLTSALPPVFPPLPLLPLPPFLHRVSLGASYLFFVSSYI
jgi:hypothetical protein